jgi:predicted GNAT family N-acyltransferase
VLEEQVFDARLHDRTAFHCGVPALDDYLHKYAAQQNAKGISTVFVLIDDTEPSKILGFYTLSAAQIAVQQISEAERKKLPRYPVPCFRMGRLARAIQSRGAGFGEILIGCAVGRCLHARTLVGAYALLVDAKDENAKSFYERYGFNPCVDSSMTLYLPFGQS